MTNNKDLIAFTESILSRYNATPDEWDSFESVRLMDDIRGGGVKMEDVTLSWPGSMTTKQAKKYLLTSGFVAVELFRQYERSRK